jgi:hypothetical protein
MQTILFIVAAFSVMGAVSALLIAVALRAVMNDEPRPEWDDEDRREIT